VHVYSPFTDWHHAINERAQPQGGRLGASPIEFSGRRSGRRLFRRPSGRAAFVTG
jgi:hypothetical protein